MTDWAKILNPEQLAAVTAGEGPTLVLAAAGTGKTRTLTHRVAWLLEQGEAPEGILLLTFTNRAAREMMERAQALAGPAIATLWSGTFHHVCHRILRREAPLLGYRRDFTILDRADALSLLNRGLKELVKDTKHFPKKEVIASLIGKAANTQADLKALMEGTLFEDPVDPAQLFAVAERYAEAKRENNALDLPSPCASSASTRRSPTSTPPASATSSSTSTRTPTPSRPSSSTSSPRATATSWPWATTSSASTPGAARTSATSWTSRSVGPAAAS